MQQLQNLFSKPELSLKAKVKAAPVAAPKPFFSLPSFGGESAAPAKKVVKTVQAESKPFFSFPSFGGDDEEEPAVKKAVARPAPKKAAPKVAAASAKKGYEYVAKPVARKPNDFSTIEAARGPRTRPADVPAKPFDLPVFLDKARSYWN